MKCLSAFSVKREHAPCRPWPLESVATGFRPLWRTCDPLLPPMSPGNTQRGLTLTTGRNNNCFSHLFYLNPSLVLTLSFLLSLPPSTGIFNLLPGKTSLWNYPFWSPGWSACVLNLPVLEQWCYCSAMSDPACLSSHPMSCDCWVMSPCQSCHCRDTHCNHVNILE